MNLVADANVLLSSITGGRAELILKHPGVRQILVTEFTLDEVQQYAPQLAMKRGLAPETVLVRAHSLAVLAVEREIYKKSIVQARKRIAKRDPDDVDVLALALHTGFPVWSNDNDFEDAGVEWFTTAELLKKLA